MVKLIAEEHYTLTINIRHDFIKGDTNNKK